MGERTLLVLSQRASKACARYLISHKGEIEVMSDMANPNLKGIGHPTISIGN